MIIFEMPKYIQIELSDMLSELGKERTQKIMSGFSCELNEDVQIFLTRKAIAFSEGGFAKTVLVFWQSDDKEEKYLVGYFALANKNVIIPKNDVSKTTYKRASQFGTLDSSGKCSIAAILIGQLSKNYSEGNDTLISGDELLQMAIDRAKEAQKIIGGKFVYLECEDKEELIEFYKRNGFVSFGKRNLDKDEDNIHGKYLIQMIRYIK